MDYSLLSPNSTGMQTLSLTDVFQKEFHCGSSQCLLLWDLIKLVTNLESSSSGGLHQRSLKRTGWGLAITLNDLGKENQCREFLKITCLNTLGAVCVKISISLLTFMLFSSFFCKSDGLWFLSPKGSDYWSHNTENLQSTLQITLFL